MFKNIFKYCIIAGLLTTAVACNKWLTVNPKTQTSEAEQFSTQQGFVDVLWGAYQMMDSVNAYGMNQTFGLVDVLAQYYEGKTSTTDYYGYAARYTYSSTSPYNVQGAIQNIWQTDYSTIAQVNYILKDIDEHKSVFSGNNYNLVKGESYALRALLHFDLLRLFGPSYVTGSGIAAIPYMRDFTVKPQQKETVQQVLNDCIGDLTIAQSLLRNDVMDNIAANQGSTSSDLITMYRQNHMNYWAVEAEMARIYLYAGQKDSALYYAREVINSKKFSFVNTTAILSDPTSPDADLTFSSEHIFSLASSSLKNTADNYFKPQDGINADVTDLYSTQAFLNSLFETTTAGYGTDIRNPSATQSLWDIVKATSVYTKKYWFDNASNVKEGLIPVIKLPEMYLIAAETSPLSDGIAYLNALRASRLLPALSTTTDSATLSNEIGKEYRKEFYGEGQLWYYYKRKDITNIANLPSGATLNENAFVFPLPQNEIEFGL